MKKKEKKKIMKIVQKFISNINGKDKRERASVVLTKIVNESKVLPTYLSKHLILNRIGNAVKLNYLIIVCNIMN